LSADEAVLLDASVLVELITRGRHADPADRLLGHLERNPHVEIVTAAHGLVEVVSALRRLNLTGALDDETATTARAWLRGLDLRLDPTAPRIEHAWALRHSMTAYDATYAAAASGLGLPLISVDQPLLAACEAAGVAAVHLERLTW
jgi:predicted nucleic acid-binding protein